jgi:hypothetical protein
MAPPLPAVITAQTANWSQPPACSPCCLLLWHAQSGEPHSLQGMKMKRMRMRRRRMRGEVVRRQKLLANY